MLDIDKFKLVNDTNMDIVKINRNEVVSFKK